jgi:hypothetical protein
MSKQDWVVTTPNLDFRCKRCGGHYQPNTPVPLELWLAMSKEFSKSHKHCTAINVQAEDVSGGKG